MTRSTRLPIILVVILVVAGIALIIASFNSLTTPTTMTANKPAAIKVIKPTNVKPLATATPKLTSTPKPTLTPAIDQELVEYLKDFGPIASEIWAQMPGEGDVDPQVYIDRLEPLKERLDALTPPKDAKILHTTFQAMTSSAALWHIDRRNALEATNDQLFQQYLDEASQYFQQFNDLRRTLFLPELSRLLDKSNLSGKDIGLEKTD